MDYRSRIPRGSLLPGSAGWLPGERDLVVVVACGTALVLGFRYRLPPDIPIGFLLAGALLPVTIRMWQIYRGAWVITVVAAAAAVSGLFLTWSVAADGLANPSLMVVQTARVLGLALGMLALLWVRSVVGIRLTVLMYGIGSLLTIALTGVNESNFWKFSFSVPTALILLSLPSVYGHKRVEVLAMTALGVMSVLHDSRSAAAMFLIGVGVVLTRHGQVAKRKRSLWPILVRLAFFCVGGFYLLQAAALEGVLGEGAQERTLEQIDRSGSLLTGGRPEIGATWALMKEQPLGFGAGTLARPGDVLTAKSGMTVLGYDPNNGYVEKYLFGRGFELHSFVGDLWVLFGPLGALLAVLVTGSVVYGMIRGLALGTTPAVLVFLGLRTMWDFAFSPFPSVMITVMLALAIALPLRRPSESESVLLPWELIRRSGRSR